MYTMSCVRRATMFNYFMCGPLSRLAAYMGMPGMGQLHGQLLHQRQNDLEVKMA